MEDKIILTRRIWDAAKNKKEQDFYENLMRFEECVINNATGGKSE